MGRASTGVIEDMTTSTAVVDLASLPFTTLDGRETTIGALGGSVRLVANVASRCGFTPQYAALERLWQTYRDRGLVVIGFPTNQFLQELGSEEAIAEFCQVNYGVTFPMSAKVKVNGRSRHPLFDQLTAVPDADGKAGRVAWNFEKWLVAADGTAHRFRSSTEPDAPEVVRLIEEALAAA
ncbi:glutathione peroxidase [Actinotalea fermentans]|uniref:Glutathione peroxidase n=2 Tax=Actinotalea fermentans TaxID=43671 RepID=A0A511YZB7_9CELL|nr:glutathione peroxidase [Actinotalea fermentans]